MTDETFSPIVTFSIDLFDLSSYGSNNGLSPLKTGPQTNRRPSLVIVAECLPAAIWEI